MGTVRGCKVVEYNVVRTRQGPEMTPRKTIPSKLPTRQQPLKYSTMRDKQLLDVMIIVVYDLMHDLFRWRSDSGV